jgi:hypothetical protein
MERQVPRIPATWESQAWAQAQLAAELAVPRIQAIWESQAWAQGRPEVELAGLQAWEMDLVLGSGRRGFARQLPQWASAMAQQESQIPATWESRAQEEQGGFQQEVQGESQQEVPGESQQEAQGESQQEAPGESHMQEGQSGW